MEGTMKMKIYSCFKRVLCYSWIFLYSGLLLFYMIVTLPNNMAMNPYTTLKCYPGLPILVSVVLCISFLMINHRYVTNVIDKTKVVFAESLTTLFMVVYTVIFLSSSLYESLYALYDMCQEVMLYVGGFLLCVLSVLCQLL